MSPALLGLISYGSFFPHASSYSGKSGTISWFMPLHIDAPLSEDPELVMVVRRSGDFYEIKTILSYDDELKDRITALSLYSKLW